MKNLKSRILFLAAFVIAGVSMLCAQNFVGGIRGLVTDPGGAVIAGATVTLTNQATGVTRTTTTNATGEYSFTQLDPATYSIAVEAQGFKKLTHPNVIVGTQENVGVDIKMELGEVTQSVEVTTEVPLVENTNASNGQVLNSQQVTDLPNLGRNVFLLSKLSTNTEAVGDPRFNRFQDQSGSSQISIGGGPIRGNNYLVDGIPITDSTNRAVIIPLYEAVQEMKVQEGTYDATMGRTGGGVFNTVLKTGSNDFHGDVFGYIRPNDMTANTFFNNASRVPRQVTSFKNFGGAMGGPVVIPKLYNGRNKFFWCISSEAYRQHTPESDSYALPTALEKQGNFSQSSVTIYDPLSSQVSTQPRTPFPGNIIPANRINPIGQNLINVLPNPQFAAATDNINFQGTDSLFDRADEYAYKAEYSVTNWLRLSGSFMYYKSREPGGNSLGIPEGSDPSNSPYLLYRHVDATALNAIMTPNATTVINLRYGFNRFPNLTEGVAYGNPQAPNLTQLGFPANFVSQRQANYFPDIELESEGISNVSLSPGNFYSKNLLGSVSKFVGRHSLTFGLDYRVLNAGPAATYNSAIFTFNGVFSRQFPNQSSTTTGADFADLLMGYPSDGYANTQTLLNEYVRYYGGYLQDDIRVNDKLTMNVGLRYEYETGVAEVQQRMAVGFNQTAINPIGANLPAGSGVIPYGVIQFAGINGNPNACCSPSHTKFGPRFGTAYQLSPKTTLRAGIGIFYAPIGFAAGESSPGYNQTNEYVASNNGNATPANSLSNPFPQGIPQPSGNTLGALTSVGNSFTYLAPNRASGGTVYQYSADIQRELWGGIAFEVGYVGSRSTGLSPSPTSQSNDTLPINEVSPANVALGQAYLNTAVPNPFFGLPGATGIIGAATTTRAQLLRPFPEYGTINEVVALSHARYDSLVWKLQKRFTHGLTFLTSFTWSRNEDNEWASGGSNAFNTLGSSGQGFIQNIYNIGAEWALAAANTPLKWSASWTYELPFGKGKPFAHDSNILNYVIGGWELQGVALVQGGFPLFVYQTNLNANIGVSSTYGQRPNASNNGTNPVGTGNLGQLLNQWINPGAFSLAPADTFGNISRDLPVYGPGITNFDLSLFKTVTIRERFTAQFRFEALNAMNRPTFAPPFTNLSNRTFGEVSHQVNLPRLVQLGIRFGW